MASTLRKRNNDGHFNIKASEADDDFEPKKSPQSKPVDGFVLFVSLSAVYLGLWIFVRVRMSHFPQPADPLNVKLSDFVEMRSRKHLDEITNLGPRVAGSESSEAAADYIIGEIAKIKSVANKVHSLELDVQTVSGTFVMDFDSIGLGKYPSVYENQKNVVVRIGPEELTHSLLVNCHFDSVIDSPGEMNNDL